MRDRLNVGPLRGGGLALLVVLATFSVVGCAESSEVREVAPGDPRAFAGNEVYNFESIGEVVRAIDVIVLGTVETIEADRPDGPPGEEVYYTVATVRVNEVWRGRSGAFVDDVIIVETLKGQPYALDWHQPGAQVLLALSETDGEGPTRYNPTSTQFVFVVEGEQLRPTQDDPFAISVAQMPLSEVRERVKRAP